ncbi:MAG: hypothetical protein AABX66_00475 [Nanoarchaeota archaeon]
MVDVYSSLVQKISSLAKLEKEEIERKIEAKRAKLSGLVSKEGAAQIVAAELGINFEKERMKINELAQGMKRANILGKVLQISPVREYKKSGREGKVANLVLADDSANVKVVFWDTNHIKLIEEGNISVGDVLEISNGMIRNGELHLSSFGDVKHSTEVIDKVVSQSMVNECKLIEAKPGQKLRNRAFIVQIFDPRYFEVCPECGKKVVEEQCLVHGKVVAKKRALLSVILDDGSASIRSVLFSEQISALGITDDEIFNLEHFVNGKMRLLGEERVFIGSVKNNPLYNTTELMIESIDKIDPAKLIDELQK